VIFIDTGPFLARYLSNDQHHRSALAVWEKLVSNHENCVTSNFVLDETFTLLGRRAGYGFAVQRAKNIYASQALTICRPDQKDEINAVQFFGKYADQHVSFTDCISIVLMKREKIHRVFSFDRHFEFAGFHVVP
jgi:predicted nucleic acid-binding protein